MQLIAVAINFIIASKFQKSFFLFRFTHISENMKASANQFSSYWRLVRVFRILWRLVFHEMTKIFVGFLCVHIRVNVFSLHFYRKSIQSASYSLTLYAFIISLWIGGFPRNFFEKKYHFFTFFFILIHLTWESKLNHWQVFGNSVNQLEMTFSSLKHNKKNTDYYKSTEPNVFSVCL